MVSATESSGYLLFHAFNVESNNHILHEQFHNVKSEVGVMGIDGGSNICLECLRKTATILCDNHLSHSAKIHWESLNT